MISPAVTYLTLEEAPQKLWHEWLSGLFDGEAHMIGPSGTDAVTFPEASLSFDQAALAQPLNGLNILVLQQTLSGDCYLSEKGKDVSNEMRWSFFVRAASTPGGLGNPEYQCRQAAQLLRACLLNSHATRGLAEKGIHELEVSEADPIESSHYQLRRIRVRGILDYDVQTHP